MLKIIIYSLMLMVNLSHAEGFGINTTRLIYPQGSRSIAAELRNTQKSEPLLVQATVSSSPSVQLKTPFNVTPPLFRLEPQSENQVRITLNGDNLPQDRESIFYFHAIAMPASNEKGNIVNGHTGTAIFAVGNVIKLFYRPAGIQGTSKEAQENMHFLIQGGSLQIRNDSQYYITITSIKLSGKQLPLDKLHNSGLMIKPRERHLLSLEGKHISGESISWNTLDDNGGVVKHVTTVN